MNNDNEKSSRIRRDKRVMKSSAKQTFALLATATVIVFLLSGSGCNYSETFSMANAELKLSSDSSTIYRFTKHYFLLVPGDTALFYGNRACTTIVNGNAVSIIYDSLYFRTITCKGERLSVDDTLYFVFPQLYQYSSSFAQIDEHTTTRYFYRSDSAIHQVAYKENGMLAYTPKRSRMVIPRTLILGPCGWLDTDTSKVSFNNKWHTSPLIPGPVTYTKGDVLFDGFSVAARVIALPQSSESNYFVNGVLYQNGALIKSYYTISGQYIQNDQAITVSGGVLITQAYFAGRGLVDQLIQTTIKRVFSDGTVEITKERSYVARGPEGAKIFSDNDIP